MPTSTTKKICNVDGCEKPFFSKDMCSQHYFQERRNPAIQQAEAEDLWQFVKKELGL
jgi:hypothetical protein